MKRLVCRLGIHGEVLHEKTEPRIEEHERYRKIVERNKITCLDCGHVTIEDAYYGPIAFSGAHLISRIEAKE